MVKMKPGSHPFDIANQLKDDNVIESYVADKKEDEVVSKVVQRFRDAALNRDREFNYLGNRTLVEYIDDCVTRFNASFDERDGIEPWQARVNVPMTHNKVSTVLGKMVAMLPLIEMVPRNGTSLAKTDVLTHLYRYAEDVDDYDELMLCGVLEAIVKGTVIGYEGHVNRQRTKRNVVGYNEDYSPKIKEEVVTELLLPGSIIALENFYPASVGIRKMEDQPYCFVRDILSHSEFISKYSCFPKHADVQPKVSIKGSTTSGVEQTEVIDDLISNDVDDGNVEVVMYFNQDTDEYVVIANGIWLNPLQGFVVSPMPYNHKKLPFWSVRFDTAGADFFYGKSLVDRLMPLQDVLNVLTNMSLDQSFLTIFPPILTAGIDPIEDDYMSPGKRIPVDTQGLPLNQAFMKLDLGTPGGWHQWMLGYVEKIMEQASVDQVTSGQAGVGGRTTAAEIKQAASGVAAILGVFGKLLNVGIKRKAILKSGNILQFWTDPSTPIISKVLGAEKYESFKNAFNIISVPGSTLSDGRVGNKMIAMYPNMGSMPRPDVVKTDAFVTELQTKTPTEIIAIEASSIRDIEMDVKFVPNLKSEDSRDVEKALVLEKARVYLSFFPDTTNKIELQNQIARIFGDDVAKAFKEATPPPQQGQPNPNGQGVNTTPQADVSANMVQSMMGGNPGAAELSSLGQ